MKCTWNSPGFHGGSFLPARGWFLPHQGLPSPAAADAVPVSVGTAARRAFSPLLAAPGRQLYTISAKAGLGLEDLRHALAATWRDLDTAAETSLVTNARHLAALQNAAIALRRVRDGLGSIPTDLLTQDLRESLYHLGSITGEITPDEVLGNIFRNFCIGK